MRQYGAWLATAIVAAVGVSSATAAEPVYWRQNVFAVPYQWNSSSNSGAAQDVRLFVSKDRGTNWQLVTTAQPQLNAFHYHAEADGEYWFAIRTSGGGGGQTHYASAAGALTPDLRVIVDTTMPRFEHLAAELRTDGALEVRWRVIDVNLSASATQAELQDAASGDWRPVSLAPAIQTSSDAWEAVANVPLAAGMRPAAVRVTVFDLAGNRAIYQAAVGSGAAGPAGQPTDQMNLALAAPRNQIDAGEWVAASAATPMANPLFSPAPAQTWPADESASSSNLAGSGRSSTPVTYGMPSTEPDDEALGIPTPTTDDRPLGLIPAQRQAPYAPLEPFRQVSMSRGDAAESPPSHSETAPPEHTPAPNAAKLVNSRTFALEYVLEDVGRAGVSRVTLWGTRDGGRSWQRYAEDSDHRSPVVVTVDGDGLYGFSIVVDGVNGRGGFAPQAGDEPELWVGVDLERPLAMITSTTPAVGTIGPELRIRWEADDDNLEAMPISLFYSSRPAGPWTAIATNLPNSGEFRWCVERYVPRQVYLRLEARDTAGNVAVFQTSETLAVEPPTHSTAVLRPFEQFVP